MILRIYIFYFVGILTLTFLGSFLLPLNPNLGLGAISHDKPFNYFMSLAQWDGGYYVGISQHGYQGPEDYAFMPVFPLTIMFFSIFLKNNIASAIIVANLSLYFTLVYLKKYTDLILKKNESKTSFFTFLFFPTTFFCLFAYSESLFLLTTVLSLYFFESNQKAKSIIFASISPLVRLVGLALPVSLFLGSLRNKGSFYLGHAFKSWQYLLPFLPFLIYLLALFVKTGDLFKFISAQSYWNRDIADPITTIFTYFWAFINLENRPINDYFDFLVTVLFLFALIVGAKKIPFYLWLYSILVVLIPTYTGTLTSMPRYVLSSLGTFLILGAYLEKRPKLKIFFWSVSLALQAILASLFINGHWVA